MATCCYCGCEFNVSEARRSINRSYGKGTYDSWFCDGDEYGCASCTAEEVSAARATGSEIMEENWSRDWGDD